MGGSGDNKLIAILVSGNNTFVSYNTFKDIGFNAVHFSGSNVTVKRNLVDRFNITKDDGAGIYCYASPNETFANIFIGENIILNAIGCPEGAGYNGDLQGESAGIYLDGNTNHAIVANNFIANGRWPGIVQLSNAHNTIINNTVYNCGRGYSNSEAANSPTGLIRDIFVRYNTFISGKPEEVCLQMTQWGLNEPFTNEGDVNYNAYLNPFGGKIVGIWYPPYGEYKEMHLEEWKQYGLDQNSFQSSIRVSSINDIKMEYNYSPVDKEVPLNGAYQGIWGDVHYNSIKIAPYRGVVLFKIYE
jgi:parallel beta-helix repeat protein